MKIYPKIGFIVAGVSLGVSALVGGLRSCNNYQINNPNLTSNSRATGFYNFVDKVEYTKLKDGSEEIQLRTENGKNVFLYQNLDGNNTVDRIRVDRYKTRDIFGLEEILVRTLDYSNRKPEFDRADKILLEERQRHSQ